MRRASVLVFVAALSAWSSLGCTRGESTCAVNEDCFRREICQESRCVEVAVEGDMAQDMGASGRDLGDAGDLSVMPTGPVTTPLALDGRAVEDARIVRTADGDLHILFVDVNASATTFRLMAIRSTDDGNTWSAPETVVDRPFVEHLALDVLVDDSGDMEVFVGTSSGLEYAIHLSGRGFMPAAVVDPAEDCEVARVSAVRISVSKAAAFYACLDVQGFPTDNGLRRVIVTDGSPQGWEQLDGPDTFGIFFDVAGSGEDLEIAYLGGTEGDIFAGPLSAGGPYVRLGGAFLTEPITLVSRGDGTHQAFFYDSDTFELLTASAAEAGTWSQSRAFGGVTGEGDTRAVTRGGDGAMYLLTSVIPARTLNLRTFDASSGWSDPRVVFGPTPDDRSAPYLCDVVVDQSSGWVHIVTVSGLDRMATYRRSRDPLAE